MWLTSGVGVDPGGGAVDLQRTPVEHLGETGSHLCTRRIRDDIRDLRLRYKQYKDEDALRRIKDQIRAGILAKGQNTEPRITSTYVNFRRRRKTVADRLLGRTHTK